MQIWLDTIDLNIISDGIRTGTISGITTNPSILSQNNNVADTLHHILNLQPGPIAVQVTSHTPEAIVEEAKHIFAFSNRLIVKIPINHSGLIAIQELKEFKIPILGTGILFPEQAFLAGKHGIAYIAPYFSHMINHGNAFESLKSMVEIFRMNNFSTKILVASIKELKQILYCAHLGVDAVTIKPDLYRQLTSNHPAVEAFYHRFSNDWVHRHGNITIKEALNKKE